jgi:hypothetical protein
MAGRNIKLDTIKALLSRCSNTCAFPGCNHPIFNESNLFVAQLCHIQAVSPGGPRYNPEQSDEVRNGYSNLMFMCYRHHKETDDTLKYPVSTLVTMKISHESGTVSEVFDITSDMVSQVAIDMKEYWKEVESINIKDASELRMEIDINSNYSDLMDEVNTLIEYIENGLFAMRKEFDELNSKALSFLKSQGYDTKIIEDLEIHQSPFTNIDWELQYLGWPNWVTKVKLRLKQIEIKYYEDYLTIRPYDKKVFQRLEGIKGELKYMARTFGYID